MNNNRMNLLRAGVFIVAAGFAFAFTQPIENQNPKFTEINGEWVLAGQLGIDYRCADVPTMICAVELVDNDPILGEVVEDSEVFGEYTPL